MGNIYDLYIIKELNDNQNKEYIEKTILSVLQEEKVSLAQARHIFKDILQRIEMDNVINL